MTGNWKTYKIEDIASKISIGPFGSRMKSDCYVDEGIPVIRGKNLGERPDFISDFVYITEKKADELLGCNVFKGDLVFPHRGAIGEVGLVTKDERFVLSSSLMKLTCDNAKADSRFVYYFFKSDIGKKRLLLNESQVGTPGIGQPLSSLRDIDISLPELPEQRAIASILLAIDDKIELNLQMNKTLEEMAMTLYKHWFVDFGPFKDGEFVDSELGMIPKGWEVKRLGDIVDVGSSNRIFLKEYVENGIPFYRGKEVIQLSKGMNISTELFITNERYKEIKDKSGVPLKNDILISSVGTIGVSWLVENDDPFYFKDGNLTWIKNYSERVNGNFISQWLKSNETQEQIKSETIGSTQQALTISALRTLKIILPPNKSSIIEEVSIKLRLWNELLLSNKKEIETLTTLRDTLLPKLISGEVRVKEAEKALAEVLPIKTGTK